MKLNGRLKAIADLIPKSEILADIGTDHAYIPIYAVKAGICDKALAADIRKGPLEMALANIRRQGLLDRIELRLGSGLLPIQPSECETIVVAGMGGSLIRDILSASYEKAAKARVLLLQPNNTVEALRKWLCENGFAIFKETLAKDAGKLYCIISAKWTGVNEIKDKFTYFIGEKVFTGNDEHLKSYLKKKLNELEVIIEGRSRADPDKSRAFSDGDGLSTEECIIMRDRLREHLKEHIQEYHKEQLQEQLQEQLKEHHKEHHQVRIRNTFKKSNDKTGKKRSRRGMVYCSDIADFLEQLAPGELAEEWDNNGLLIGDREKEIKSIMVCLDVTRASLEAAVERDADLVVTHHPVIFKGLKRLNGDDAKGEIIISLIRSGINVYSAHTNLDFARFGVNTQLAAALGLHDTEIMGRGPGRFGSLERRMSLNEFADHVKSRLSTPHLRVTGNADSGVGKVAVFGGSFDDDLEAFAGTGADVLVTGDLKYHTALDASEAGLCIVDAGHFNTEKTVLPYLTEALSQRFPDISVTRFEGEKDPFISY